MNETDNTMDSFHRKARERADSDTRRLHDQFANHPLVGVVPNGEIWSYRDGEFTIAVSIKASNETFCAYAASVQNLFGVAGLPIRVVGTGGVLIAEGKTDFRGQWLFTVPKSCEKFEVSFLGDRSSAESHQHRFETELSSKPNIDVGNPIRVSADLSLNIAGKTEDAAEPESNGVSENEILMDSKNIRMAFSKQFLPLGIVILRFIDTDNKTLVATITHCMNCDRVEDVYSCILRVRDFPKLKNSPTLPQIEAVAVDGNNFREADREVIASFVSTCNDKKIASQISELLREE